MNKEKEAKLTLEELEEMENLHRHLALALEILEENPEEELLPSEVLPLIIF